MPPARYLWFEEHSRQQAHTQNGQFSGLGVCFWGSCLALSAAHELTHYHFSHSKLMSER